MWRQLILCFSEMFITNFFFFFFSFHQFYTFVESKSSNSPPNLWNTFLFPNRFLENSKFDTISVRTLSRFVFECVVNSLFELSACSSFWWFIFSFFPLVSPWIAQAEEGSDRAWGQILHAPDYSGLPVLAQQPGYPPWSQARESVSQWWHGCEDR